MEYQEYIMQIQLFIEIDLIIQIKIILQLLIFNILDNILYQKV